MVILCYDDHGTIIINMISMGYNSAVKLKLQAYGKILHHVLRNFDAFRMYALQIGNKYVS